MSLPGDIASFLQTSGLGTVGTDIFVGELPESPDNCISIFQSGGEPPIDQGMDTIDRPGLQVIVRNSSYESCESTILSVQSLINQKELTINSVYYPYFGALQAPFPIGRDDQNLIRFVQNYSTLRRNV